MTFDLTLGFHQKPAALGETLSALGFTFQRVVPKDDIFGVTMEYYEFFDPNRSRSGVYLIYHDGTYPDHQVSWERIVDDANSIVATASITASMRRNAFDEEKQLTTGRFLRDYYQAVLYDPQAGKLISE